jgi:septum formation protein
VVYAGGRILGKPADIGAARDMITLLQGGSHTVYTGVCVVSKKGGSVKSCATEVFFSPMDEREIEAYLAKGDMLDKAGAYAIQGSAAPFIERIEGCYFNVVGLPLNMLYGMLAHHTGR